MSEKLGTQEAAQLPSSTESIKLGTQEAAQLPSFAKPRKTGHARHRSTAEFYGVHENWARKTPLNCRVLLNLEKLGRQERHLF